MSSITGVTRNRHSSIPAYVTLAIATCAINLLGLVIPLMAQLIFSRILPTPGSATLSMIVVVAVLLALIEVLLRIGRSYLTNDAGNALFGHLYHRVFRHITRSRYITGERGSARAIDFLSEINKLRDGRNGRVVVQITDILFIPIILGLIIYVAPIVGLVVTLCLCFSFLLMANASRELQWLSRQSAVNQETRYRFLFRVLRAVHPLKALGAEDFVIRRYEAIQGQTAHMTFRSGMVVAHFMTASLMLSHFIVAISLITGAIAVNSGLMTLGSMSSVTLLSARMLGPLQRAVLARAEHEDRVRAEEDLGKVFQVPEDARSNRSVGEFPATLKLETQALAVQAQGGEEVSEVTLSVEVGETIAISGGDDPAISALLRCCAGLDEPQAGKVVLAGQAISDWSQDDLDALIAYVPSTPVMFAGTVAENLTRFGKVTVEQALSVASLVGARDLIDRLPAGLETELVGGLSEKLPIGMCQQLSLVRALVHRPRIILLDHVDRGLDRESYARLSQFLANIRGQAGMVIASDDANFISGASVRWRLKDGTLELQKGAERAAPVAYRTLKL